MLDRIRQIITGKKIVIVGFGMEGHSTYRFLREHFGDIPLAVADKDPAIAEKAGQELNMEGVIWLTGPGYLENLGKYDILIKSPGISLSESFYHRYPKTLVTSQAAIVMAEFHRQIIGVTGTKGKSTTSSLIHHILQSAGIDSILIGNIGIPPLDSIHLAGPGTTIVYELSSHQLEDISQSPHIAVLLNLFPEHLDRYPSINEYFRAKWNIFLTQGTDDVVIINHSIDPKRLPGPGNISKGKILRFGLTESDHPGCYLEGDRVIIKGSGGKEECCALGEELFLKGRHNRMNMMAAILACREAGAGFGQIMDGIRTFHGLEHRLEYVGCYGGIHFYNDSIATIPEAAMEAVRAIPGVDTIILGGYDRMLDYSELIGFLMGSTITNLIFMGKAGDRMMEIAGKHDKKETHKLFKVNTIEEAFQIIPLVTQPGSVCLLSPAAASYDVFKNFEERGRLFKKTARNL
jgi:UDP-N-acetylmuramoyl-L-alanine---L-glutamate ligase